MLCYNNEENEKYNVICRRPIISNNIIERKLNDLVDVVSNPNNIEKYDVSCKYYTELALATVKQSPKMITKISKQCFDYFEICKTAILEDSYQIINIDVNYPKYAV